MQESAELVPILWGSELRGVTNIQLDGNETIEIDDQKYDLVFIFSEEKGHVVPRLEETV